MLHEAGHFLTAKLFGMKATQFFVGFGPTLWSRQSGETEYGVKAIPAGGFVKIIGMTPLEDVAPEDAPRAFINKPGWQRFIVLVAGSTTHFVIALVLLLIVLLLGWPPSTTRRRPRRGTVFSVRGRRRRRQLPRWRPGAPRRRASCRRATSSWRSTAAREDAWCPTQADAKPAPRSRAATARLISMIRSASRPADA